MNITLHNNILDIRIYHESIKFNRDRQGLSLLWLTRKTVLSLNSHHFIYCTDGHITLERTLEHKGRVCQCLSMSIKSELEPTNILGLLRIWKDANMFARVVTPKWWICPSKVYKAGSDNIFWDGHGRCFQTRCSCTFSWFIAALDSICKALLYPFGILNKFHPFRVARLNSKSRSMFQGFQSKKTRLNDQQCTHLSEWKPCSTTSFL